MDWIYLVNNFLDDLWNDSLEHVVDWVIGVFCINGFNIL